MVQQAQIGIYQLNISTINMYKLDRILSSITLWGYDFKQLRSMKGLCNKIDGISYNERMAKKIKSGICQF